MRFKLFWMLFILISQVWISIFPQLDLVRIQFPTDGEVIKGNVQLVGSITGQDFQFADISFRYQDSTSDTWFLITSIDSNINDGVIASWDTSTIADGLYQLRVLAHYENGNDQEAIVKDIQVRNYSPTDPVPTRDASSPPIDATPLQSITVITSATQEDTPTPMPFNELTVTRSQFFLTVLQSAIFGILLLIVAILFIIIRRRKLG